MSANGGAGGDVNGRERKRLCVELDPLPTDRCGAPGPGIRGGEGGGAGSRGSAFTSPWRTGVKRVIIAAGRGREPARSGQRCGAAAPRTSAPWGGDCGPRSRCLPTARSDPRKLGGPSAGLSRAAREPDTCGTAWGCVLPCRSAGGTVAVGVAAGLFTLAALEQDTVDRPERRHDHAAAGEPRRNLRPQGLAARALASTLSAEHSACVLACVRLGERACADAYAHTRAKCATRVRRRWTI